MLSKPISRIEGPLLFQKIIHKITFQNSSRNLLSKTSSRNYPKAALHNPEPNSQYYSQKYSGIKFPKLSKIPYKYIPENCYFSK